jgi:hypothetical protein
MEVFAMTNNDEWMTQDVWCWKDGVQRAITIQCRQTKANYLKRNNNLLCLCSALCLLNDDDVTAVCLK